MTDAEFRQDMEYYKQRDRKRIFFACGIIILFIGGAYFLSGPSSPNNQPKSASEIRKEKIQAQFSAFDGSHREFEQSIKENMHDPDSYEHIETRYKDEGEYLFVSTKFRGTNAFGAKVINYKTAKVQLNGRIIEIIK